MSEHTAGRLNAIHGSYLVVDGTGESIGRCGTHGPHVQNARRLAACWNACEGLSTESLEHNPPLADQLVEALNGKYEAERQRDRLQQTAQALHNRGFFAPVSCADHATLEDMRRMREALAF